MSLTVSDTGGGDFTPAPAGTHLARCVRLIDVGTHYNEKFGKRQSKIQITFELPDEMIDTERGPEPHLVSGWYTASLHEKSNLRAVLEAWRGRAFTEKELQGFNLASVLDKPCQLAVVHKVNGDKTYANIGAVMAMGKGQKCPARVNELLNFDLDDPDEAVLAKLSDRMREKIEDSDEWQARLVDAASGTTGVAPVTSDKNDDLPF